VNGFFRPSLAPRCAGTISREMAFRWCLSTAWLRVILRLSPRCQRSLLRERRKILIDLPGFGYSDKPRDFSYNIHEQALVLEQFLSHLRLQRFALFGHSMGGSIAIEAAGLLGER
jgi:pimeloyl-ACP methyl ester carboxylesterase